MHKRTFPNEIPAIELREFSFGDIKAAIIVIKMLSYVLKLSNGMQPKDVQEFLGHLYVRTTMNVYAHAIRETKRDSAKLLDKVVGMN